MLLTMLESLEKPFLSNPICLLLYLIPPFFILIFLNKWLFQATTTKCLPPSPPKLPIIGNFHQLGTLPRRTFLSLAQRYGPLMLLHLGKVPVLVVSSPDAAREIMKNRDLFFANKPELRNFKLLLYGMKDVLASPYGDHWKQLKSIFVHNLLSKKSVQSFRLVREEETSLLIKKIIVKSCSSISSPVDFRDLFETISNDVVCRAAFGRKYTGDENGEKLMHLLREFSMLLGAIAFRDYVPMLGWLDHLNGKEARMKRVAKGLDEFLEGLIEERMVLLEKHGARGVNLAKDGENFIDIMLKINYDGTGISLSRDSIKAVLLDAYAGGTETTSAFLEWAMAELLHNPKSMKKLQNEVTEILKGKLSNISEDELEQMVFLKAVIKETLRLHPPASLHSRTTRQDTKLMGYDIAAGTTIIINSWGISNDPNLWDQPHEFRPERFLNSSVDFKGHHFEFTPFGAGRRQCPGTYFATSLIEYVLANLVYMFNWELVGAVKGEDMDMTECPASVVHRKKFRLRAIATPFS